MATLLIDFAAMGIFSLVGFAFLRNFMLVQILFIGIFGNQEITVFGLTSNIGNLFYASVVFGMCLMMEIYGVEEARRTRNVLAGCVLAASLLGVVPVGSQILIASLAAFLAAQTVFIH